MLLYLNFPEEGFSITISQNQLWICGKDNTVLDSGKLLDKLSVVEINSLHEFNQWGNHIEYDGPGVYCIVNECEIMEKVDSNIVEFIGRDLEEIKKYVSEMVVQNDSAVDKKEEVSSG